MPRTWRWRRLLGFGDAIEVLEPAALREKIVAAARGTIGRYGG